MPLTSHLSSPTSKSTAFGERANNNSIMTAKLYASYSDERRTVKKDSLVDSRAIAYYSNITAEQTNQFFQDMQQLTPLTSQLSPLDGWNGVIVPDGDGEYGPDCTYFMLLSNFSGEKECTLKSICNRIGKPVFTTRTTIDASGSTAIFTADVNHSVVNTLKFFINGTGMEAIQEKDDSTAIYLLNLIKGNNKLTVTAFDKGKTLTKDVKLSTKVLKVSIRDGELVVEDADAFPDDRNLSAVFSPHTSHLSPHATHHYYDLQGRLIATSDETQSPSGKLPRGIYVKDNKIIAGTTARQR